MLCFLPPLVPPPRQPLPPRPRGQTVATCTAGFVAVAALLLPVGWMHLQPVYELRVGVASRLDPRTGDRTLAPRLDQGDSTTRRRRTFSLSHDAYGAVPPGLDVDATTGALVGTPTLPGTYTLAVAVSDGAAHKVSGPTFQVRVLPPS